MGGGGGGGHLGVRFTGGDGVGRDEPFGVEDWLWRLEGRGSCEGTRRRERSVHPADTPRSGLGHWPSPGCPC